jgi:hypothetical protein
MPERPAAAVSEADGALIRPLSAADLPLLRDLYQYRENRVFASRLEIGDGFLDAVQEMPWATPMVLQRDAEAVALALVTSADVHNRNGRLVVLAHHPLRASGALSLYLRHVFWSHPFHRLYAAMPANLPQSERYIELLSGVGFVDEGRLVSHLEWRGRMLDVAVLGLLRPEFDAWLAAAGRGVPPL